MLAPAALAGGGPENLLLVVNPRSPASMTIANHYVQLRHVPARNVFYLPWNPQDQTTDVATFRKKILGPVLATIELRGLTRQIDCVAYSSDYPWAINAQADVDALARLAREATETAPGKEGNGKPKPDPKANPKPNPKPQVPSRWPGHLRPTCSLNGLTYLWQPVVTANALAYVGLRNNQYMRRAVPQQKTTPTLGFKSSHRFGPHGEQVDSGGSSYMLSVVLGVTAGRGNSVAEVLDYLTRSAAADGTHPKGTVYFVRNGNIRSRIRQGAFPAAVKGLDQLGVAAEVLEGVLPQKKPDVQGAMIGAAGFDWKKSGSTILPGAICEHLTSFGGVMRAGAGQTPLSELLRYGAAGASGTVTEPLAIAAKFPLAMIHVHYARGCTLAEAFYQSVYGPYQLLIVGDPLCRPWANIPQVSVDGVQPRQTLKGTVKITPTATLPRAGKINRFELLADGLRLAECHPGQTLTLDTTRLADGHHELRIVAVEAGLIQSQGQRIIPVVVNNHGRKLEASIAPQGEVRADAKLTVTARCPGAASIDVFQNARPLGTIAGAEGRLKIPARTLGLGPVRLHAVARGPSGAENQIYGPPLVLKVVE